MRDTTADTERQAGRKKLSPVGTRGYYISPNDLESPRYGEWCEVVAHYEGLLLLAFDDPYLGEETVEQGQFYPRVYRFQGAAGVLRASS